MCFILEFNRLLHYVRTPQFKLSNQLPWIHRLLPQNVLFYTKILSLQMHSMLSCVQQIICYPQWYHVITMILSRIKPVPECSLAVLNAHKREYF